MSTTETQPHPQVTERAADGLLGLAERGVLPDAVVRLGIRRLCHERLAETRGASLEDGEKRHRELIRALHTAPVAIHGDKANRQHYEVPTAFFEHCLGRRLKYSSCYFPSATTTLDEAEEAMLALYAQRAQLADGQDILELGCGWGSLTIWMAQRYPSACITAVSNSHSQRAHIEARIQQLGLRNVHVITCDVNVLALPAHQFDRCVSVEMFEHVRNHAVLLRRIAGWLRPDGRLFVHIFAHRTTAYLFETEGQANWMGRHFFTGGMMPSADTLLWMQDDMRLTDRWLMDGTHYERTANAWLANQDRHRDAVLRILGQAHGSPELAQLWFHRWRMFWMACAELFGYAHGQEWVVAHYALTPRTRE